jgi:uroporphyrinogen decarboxylase
VKPKDNVLAAIKLGKPSRIPAVLFSGGAWTFNNRGLTLEHAVAKAELMAQVIIETNAKVESDIVWAGSGFNNLPVKALGGKVKWRAKGTMDVQEPLLKTASDVDRIDLDQLSQDEGIINVWESTALLDRAIGDGILIGACGWGPFTLGAQMFGVEKMMRSIRKDKKAVHAVLEFAAEASFRYYDAFRRKGARIISVAEPSSSGDMVSRQHFEELVLPCLTAFIKKTKEAGALNLLHICGQTTKYLDLIPGTGADVISVDYKVDLAEAKEILGTKMAFAGNVNPAGVLVNGTPGEVAAASRECIEKAGTDGNFILMPGCDLSPSVPLANVRAMIETAQNWPL